TSIEIESAFVNLGSFDQGSVFLGKWCGQTPWEFHPDGDEFLLILEGNLLVTLLKDDYSQEILMDKGSTCIIPRAIWHRSRADFPVTLLAIIGSQHGAVSFAQDPRVQN
ncbi:MAG: cupin domain-containing protein, partial [Cyanobacteria bacterium P01_F01_bin.143]